MKSETGRYNIILLLTCFQTDQLCRDCRPDLNIQVYNDICSFYILPCVNPCHNLLDTDLIHNHDPPMFPHSNTYEVVSTSHDLSNCLGSSLQRIQLGNHPTHSLYHCTAVSASVTINKGTKCWQFQMPWMLQEHHVWFLDVNIAIPYRLEGITDGKLLKYRENWVWATSFCGILLCTNLLYKLIWKINYTKNITTPVHVK